MPDGLYLVGPDRMPEAYQILKSGVGEGLYSVNANFSVAGVPTVIPTLMTNNVNLSNAEINGFTLSSIITRGSGNGMILLGLVRDKTKSTMDYALLFQPVGAANYSINVPMKAHIEAFCFYCQLATSFDLYSPAQTATVISFY